LKNDTSGFEDVIRKNKLTKMPMAATTTRNQGPLSHLEFMMQLLVNSAAEYLRVDYDVGFEREMQRTTPAEIACGIAAVEKKNARCMAMQMFRTNAVA
jgi:hypothetical protein